MKKHYQRSNLKEPLTNVIENLISRCNSLKYFTFFLLLLTFQASLSQSKIDSLSFIIQTASGTQKVVLLNQLSEEWAFLDQKKALVYAEEALILSQEIDYKKGEAKASYNFAKNLLGLSKRYRANGSLEIAKSELLKGLSLSEKIEESSLIQGFNLELYQYYNKRHVYQDAYKYYRAYITSKNRLLRAQKTQQVTLMKERFDIEKKEKEGELLKKDVELKTAQIERSNLERSRLIWLVILLAMIGGIGLYFFWRKQKSNRELRSKNEQVNDQSEQIKISLKELSDTQSQLVQSEKLAALGQLASGIAHEVSTPLGAINSSAENIDSFVNHIFIELPKLAKSLNEKEWNLFFQFMSTTQEYDKVILGTREKRKIKNHLKKELENYNVQNLELILDVLVESSHHNDITSWSSLIQHPKSKEIYHLANSLINIESGTNITMIAVKKMSKIISALKKFSSQDQVDEKVVVDVVDTVETVLTVYQNLLKQRVKVEKNYQPVPKIALYAGEIIQVWTNLLHNALHAMGNEGKLKIETKLKDNEVIEVSIQDDGPGIPIKLQKRIFEPYFTTKKKGEGSGLGLDIARKIVEKHNGTIRFETAAERGTSFIVSLPLKGEPKQMLV